MAPRRRASGTHAKDALDERHVALALSGGGVRSSSVCTGVMCWLATCGLLDCVTMVSVVSGGGYAGGSLVNWWQVHARQQQGGAQGAWLFKFMEHMLTAPNVLGSYNNWPAIARDLGGMIVMYSIDFLNVALCGLPEGLLLAEVIAAVLRSGADESGVLTAGGIWRQLLVVRDWTAIALALVMLVLLVVYMRRRTDTAQQASRRFIMQQRVMYAVQAAVFVVAHFAIATLVACSFLFVEALHDRNTWFLSVFGGVWMLSRAFKHLAGDAFDVITSSVVWMTVYGRIAAWRTAAEGPGASHEVMGFDTPTWRWCMFGVGVFMALVHPFGQLLMDDGWGNFYRRHIAGSYFPRKKGARPWSCLSRSLPLPSIPPGVEDPTLDQLREAEEQFGVPRLVVNVTCNNWRRKVTVSVAKSTVDSTGHPRVARKWDNGVAQVSLDSTGYVRIDEGCRGVGCNNQTPGECAGCDAHAAEASGTYASGVPPVKLSSALGMSGAAVSAELGNKTRDWTVVSMLARTGISWARYLNLSPEKPFVDSWVGPHAVFAALFVPLMAIPWTSGTGVTWLAVASYTLFSLFRITSPYHVLWPAMISFPPSRHFRESLNFDWWEPAVRVRGAVDYHWVRHGMYMSDGGHTENLGVLPLLRLRAKRIVSVDAGADSTHACTSLLQVVDSVPRLFGFQFLAPPHMRREYPDVKIYIRDKLLLDKPNAFLLSVLYNPEAVGNGGVPEEGQLLYLKPHKTRARAPKTRRRSAFRAPSTASPASDAGEFESKASFFSSTSSVNLDSPTSTDGTLRQRFKGNASSGSINSTADAATADRSNGRPPRVKVALEDPHALASDDDDTTPGGARAAHFKATHHATWPDEDMVGCCCNGCNRRSRCGWTTPFCGAFPNLSTTNQFLTERQKRALHMTGYKCGMEAWDARNGACWGFFDSLRSPLTPMALHR